MAVFGRRVQTAVNRADAVSGTAAPAHSAAIGRLLGALNIWFWAIVGVPTLVAGVYYFGIASDLYLSEAKFIVRGPQTMNAATPGSITAMFSGGGMSAGGDVSEVREFMLSRDAVRDLSEHDELRAAFSRPEGDILTRFPGVEFWRRDFEALYKTYQRFVTIQIDASGGIATLNVEAYRPEDAQRIATALMTYGEALVNELNARALEDSIKTSRAAVKDAEQRVAQVQQQLSAYRIKEQMLDPTSASSGHLLLISSLDRELATARGQLSDMLQNSPRSPALPLLRTRIASLEKLVAEQHSRVTGDTDSVATKTTEYERLSVQRTLDEKALASAFTSLEAARLQAQQHQLFLEQIAQPNLPDYPLYPKRVSSFLLVVVTCFLAYGIAWLVVAGVREHASA
jgi:capsular polysaccharide transport system permease protein